MSTYRLIASEGCGSVIVEAALDLADLTFETDFVDYSAPGPGRDRLLALNPLGQVPTLVLPDGQVMTESAAIILHIADVAPAAGLVPPPGDPLRPRFLRTLLHIVAAIYPTFTYADNPARWVGEAAAEELRQRVFRHREFLWREIERNIEPSPWFLGERFSALDLYVCAMTRWRPRRAWFAENCPKLTSVALAADAHPGLAKAWARNFG
jgi:GST-like protein